MMLKKQTKFIILLLSCGVLLSGCNRRDNIQNDMRNVEERDYATILLASNGEDGKRYRFSLGIAQEKKVGEESQIEELSNWNCNDFEELAETYQLVRGKDLSLSHLKVILLSMKEMEVTEEMQEFLYLLDENVEIAKTCPVLELKEKDEFLEYLKKAEEPVGTYLNNVMETSRRQARNIPWLKDYLRALREGTDVEVYFLEKVPEGWQLNCRKHIGNQNT